jgi:hypothetical protein
LNPHPTHAIAQEDKEKAMNPPLKRMTLSLFVAAIAWSLLACSKDLTTGPTTKPAAGPAQADVSILAAPANDDFDNALVITSLPFTSNISTVEATIAPDDPLGQDLCGFGSVDGHTVWYKFSPTQNIRINVNTVGSSRDFQPNIFAYTGTRGNLTEVTCNFLPASMTLDAFAGETYYFLVGSQGDDPGGNLVLTVQPSLEVSITINRGSVSPSTGVAVISGTMTCSRPTFVDGGVAVERRIGGNVVSASANFPSDCDGVMPWELEMVPDGRFIGGPAQVRAGALFTDNSSTEERLGNATATVILKGGR